MSKQGKIAVIGGSAAVVIMAFSFFAWGQAVDRSAEAVISEATRIQRELASNVVPEGKDIAAPNLDRSVVITANLSEQAKLLSIARIAELTAMIRKNPELSSWLELGVYRKAIGDWDGAEEIWTYLSSVNPSDAISLANLANLYLYERKDPKKAETFLLAAIERNPTQVSYYEAAYELYHFVLKNDAKGKAIIQKGLLRNPADEAAFRDILSRF